jgi:hypothetical protein
MHLYLRWETPKFVKVRNLENSALRIEKEGKKFRLLYAGG